MVTAASLTTDKLALLGKSSLFEGLRAAELKRLEHMFHFHQFKRGAVIFTPESDSRDIFLVLEGKVRIVNYSLSGREVAYATAEAGDYFGELAAIDGEQRSATVAALQPCLLASFSPRSLREIVELYPQIALRILKKLAAIVRSCDERIMDLATLSAYQRVYSELLKLVKPDPVRPDSWMVYPLPTQAAIAAQASTTRETVARVVSQLTHAGLCERKGRTLYVRDVEKLRALAERLGTSSFE